MQPDQSAEYLNTARRKRTWRIVMAHLLVVAAFFIASFIWGNFA